jgi:hypothetical protein
MTGQHDTASTALGRALHNVYARPVMADKIHVGGSEIANLAAEVTAKVERLQKTSGMITADPRLSTTPRDSVPITSARR